MEAQLPKAWEQALRRPRQPRTQEDEGRGGLRRTANLRKTGYTWRQDLPAVVPTPGRQGAVSCLHNNQARNGLVLHHPQLYHRLPGLALACGGSSGPWVTATAWLVPSTDGSRPCCHSLLL